MPGTTVPTISPDAVGSAPTVPPVSVAGIDGGGLKRDILTGTDGRPAVNLSQVGGTTFSLGGTTASASIPVTLASDGTFAALTGSVTETAPATDTASSGLNGRMQRIAQRLSSMITLLPASLGQKTMSASLAVTLASDQSAIPVTGTFFQATQPVSIAGTVAVSGTFFQATQPVSAASLPLPTLAATSTKQSDGTQKTQVVDGSGNVIGATSNALDINIKSGNPTSITANAGTNLNTSLLALESGGNLATLVTDVGGLTETAPATDTASSGLNGRMQRIAQRLTSMIALTPASLGQKVMASSFAVAIASDQSALSITGLSADTAPATQNITTQDLVSATATGANSQSIITGAPTAGSAASFALSGVDTVLVEASGTWTGTLQVEVSFDGGTRWYIRGVHQAGTNFNASTFTANFGGGANVGGFTNFRIRATAAMTGTAIIQVSTSQNQNSIYLANTPKLADGTTPSTTATVKAASTAPATTDTNLVVGIANGNDVAKGATTDSAATTDTGTFSEIALIKRLLVRSVTLKATTVVIASIQTNATGTTYNALSSAACDYISFSNQTGFTLEYLRSAAGTAFQIPTGAILTIMLPTGNANELSFRRTDTLNGQVTATYEKITQ